MVNSGKCSKVRCGPCVAVKTGCTSCGGGFAARSSKVPGVYAAKVAAIARGKGEKKVKATTQSSGAVGLAVERRAYVLQLKGVPHIPTLPPNNYGDDLGYRYLVMQLMSGSLKDKARTVGGVFSPAAIAHVGASLVRGRWFWADLRLHWDLEQ